jgi:hypothetical protein
VGREPELLGVVAFLGRVEDDALNTRLMEWIGGKKDSVVCRVSFAYLFFTPFWLGMQRSELPASWLLAGFKHSSGQSPCFCVWGDGK